MKFNAIRNLFRKPSRWKWWIAMFSMVIGAVWWAANWWFWSPDAHLELTAVDTFSSHGDKIKIAADAVVVGSKEGWYAASYYWPSTGLLYVREKQANEKTVIVMPVYQFTLDSPWPTSPYDPSLEPLIGTRKWDLYEVKVSQGVSRSPTPGFVIQIADCIEGEKRIPTPIRNLLFQLVTRAVDSEIESEWIPLERLFGE